ncbi:hypothetical protein D3C72_391980 [compost metagenome]
MRTISIFAFLALSFTATAKDQKPEKAHLPKKRVEFGLKFDVTKRHSNEYFNNDTTNYGHFVPDPAYAFKDNFQAINFNLKYYYPKYFIVLYEFRWRIDGFKGLINIPDSRGLSHYGLLGYRSTIANLDLNISLMRRFKFKSFEFRPKAGFHLFCPNLISNSGVDSNIYQNFGETEYNINYQGSILKFGYNIGSELCYKLSRTIHFNLTATYYSPFNNTYGWHRGERVAGSQYPWHKWRIKNDGFYIGLGVSIDLRKNERNY